MAWRNSRTNERNAVLLAQTGELKAEKSFMVLVPVLALFEKFKAGLRK